MKLNLWLSLPLSVICIAAHANTTTTTTAPAAATTTTAPAAATSTTAAPAAAKKEEAPSVKFGFVYGGSYSLQAEKQADGTRTQAIGHEFTGKMSYGDYRASVYSAYENDIVDTSGTGSFTDPAWKLSRKSWTLNDYLSMGPALTLTIPMNASSKEDDLYTVGGALSFSLNTKTLGLDSLSLGNEISANKYFTKYDTTSAGSPSKSHRFRNRITVGYDITDKFSFFNLFDFNFNYSVNGVVTNSFFSLQSFGYTLSDNVSVSLSHTNGGAYLKSGTYENNLKFYDSKSSNYSVGLEVSL